MININAYGGDDIEQGKMNGRQAKLHGVWSILWFILARPSLGGAADVL